jgi:hypothetical protein
VDRWYCSCHLVRLRLSTFILKRIGWNKYARDRHMSVFELGVRRLEYEILACDLEYLHASAVLADNTRSPIQ